MKPETIERSIYWQRHVMHATTDPAQRERCRQAIDKLTVAYWLMQEHEEGDGNISDGLYNAARQATQQAKGAKT